MPKETGYSTGKMMGMAKKNGEGPAKKRVISGKGKKRAALGEKPRFIAATKNPPSAKPGYIWVAATSTSGQKGLKEVKK